MEKGAEGVSGTLSRSELSVIAEEVGVDASGVSDPDLLRRILEHPRGEKLIVAADTSIARALRSLFQAMGRDDGFVDADADWIAFNSADAYVEAEVKAGMDPLLVIRIDAYLLSSADAMPSEREVSAWVERQPAPVLGVLSTGARERGDATEYLPVVSLEVAVDSVVGEFVVELIAPFAEAWDHRAIAEVAALEFGPGGFPYRLDDPVERSPKSSWLLVGTEASFPSGEEVRESFRYARAGINDLMWTAPKTGDIGDLVLLYFLAPNKAVHFVARLASRPFWRTDIDVAADKAVDTHQWWAYLTPLIEIEAIPYAVLQAAHGGHLPLRGRSGHYLAPNVIAGLAFTAVDPSQQGELDRIAVVPVGDADLPRPEATTFAQWCSLPAGKLRLEARVSEHIVRPLGHLVHGPDAEWTKAEREVPLDPALGPYLVPEVRVPSGYVDFVFTYPANTPAVAVEVKLTILRPASGRWSDSADFRQLRRYMDDLGVPGMLVDAQRVLLVRAGADEPFAEVIRSEASWADVALIRDLLVSTMPPTRSPDAPSLTRPRRVIRRG